MRPSYLGSGTRIRIAIQKHGKENFKREILEFCEKDVIDEREIFWIKELDAMNPEIGYNILPGGGSTLGFRHSEETIQNKFIGRTHSEEARAAIQKFNSGKTLTDDHKKKIGVGNTGKVRSEEMREQLRVINTGRVDSEEIRKNKSLGQQNRAPATQATRDKIGIAHTGKVVSEETKAKQKASALKREKPGEETKAKLKEIVKNRPILICPWCHRESNNTGSMMQFHSDNCKQNPNYIPKQREEIVCPHCGKVGHNKSGMKRYHFENCKLKLDEDK